MSTWKVTNDMVEALSSSKLTGALPAIDGSNLTGISGFPDTTSASDPATNTNPAGGIGTTWMNSTDGELFVCTDTTTDNNVWTNVGAGTGNIQPYSFQGTNYGYFYGSASVTSAGIEKVNLNSDENSTDVGDQSVSRTAYTACTSVTHGYCCGGNGGTDVIDKLLFTAEGIMVDVGNLALARTYCSGESSETDGYVSGNTNIDKFSFSSDGDATDWADLSNTRNGWNGTNSDTHGYHTGGYDVPFGYFDTIDKFPFASQVNATDIGNLLSVINQNAASGSTTYGYSMGGYNPSSNVTQKWAYASDGDATNVGDLTVARFCAASCSSTAFGYVGGGNTGPAHTNVIDKTSFSSDVNSFAVGDMSIIAGYLGLGSQY